MKILIDTNIIIDFFLDRKPYSADAEKLLLAGACNSLLEFATTLSLNDVNYITHRGGIPNKTVQIMLKELLKVITALPVNAEDFETALDADWMDLEDAVQFACAKNNGFDVIITRNPDDFKLSDIPVYTPSEFIESRREIFEQLPTAQEALEQIKYLRSHSM